MEYGVISGSMYNSNYYYYFYLFVYLVLTAIMIRYFYPRFGALMVLQMLCMLLGLLPAFQCVSGENTPF